ncbi:MAG: hypothetical protein DRN49_02115 [Thaumarchaeota archaeon]|nr:MAG: hypothetical protein DRN49_02115 [Nitrososphaerota archaeon]
MNEMMLELTSGIGIIISFIFLLTCYNLHKNLRDHPIYSLGRIFLRKESILAFILMVICFIIFAAARIVSYTLILCGISGTIEMKIIATIRAPMDLIGAILLTSSVMILYLITRRKS